MLATTTADWSAADGYFAAASATLEGMGARPWLARTQVEQARMLLARAEPGDAEQADEVLHQALATARELGLTQVKQDADNLRNGT
jgi:hypothetical protein